MAAPGMFVLSLDFELHWGVRYRSTVEQERDNLLGARAAVPAMLALFQERGLHATWATVGMLFCQSKAELLSVLPRRRPQYQDRRLDPYGFEDVGADEASDPFHFAPSLIERIARTPGQEIGTHTFSHYYCLALGQTAEDFDADLESARRATARFGDCMGSLVFPRAQINSDPEYWRVIKARGIRTYRSTGGGFPYRESIELEPLHQRGLRLLDSYVPVSGSRVHARPRIGAEGLVDVPASAFLRPHSQRRRTFDRLRLRRMTHAMTGAATSGGLYHLWWHVENFGSDLRENMNMLAAVADHFEALRASYDMRSLTMAEAASAPTDHEPQR